MHSQPHEMGSDTWVLQEKCIYTFQQPQAPYRRRDYNPAQEQRTQRHEAPDIIILSLWPQASQHQVQYYVDGYHDLYPTARVILSPASSASASMVDDRHYNRTMNELINAQPLTTIDHNPHLHFKRPSVLLHLFGTSGAAGACRLLRGFRLRTEEPLNVGAVIADTEPSATFTTFLTSSYQPFSSAIFSLLLAFWMRLQEYMFFWPPEPRTAQIHHDLNNPYLLPSGARKCFIFAQRGLMLTWMKSSLSQHAAKAGTDVCSTRGNSTGLEMWNNDEQDERREYTFRRSSVDRKGRWNGDQEQYWSGIEGVWEGQ